MIFNFERSSQRLMSWRLFLRRMVIYIAIATGINLVFLGIGTLGFHSLEPLDWMGAALNAAMIMTGNGPIVAMHTAAGRAFQLCYAMMGGIVFLLVGSVILGPVIHRILHAFHLSIEDAGR